MTSVLLHAMRRILVVSGVIAALAALGAVRNIAEAQTPTTAQCTSARDLLLKSNGGSRSDLVEASNILVRCGAMAPNAIMAVLRAAAPNSLRDTLARRSAWSLQDGVLMDSLAHYSVNTQTSTARRTFALAMLMRYVDPSAGLNPAGATQFTKPVIVNVFDDDPFIGTTPMDDIRRTIALNHIAQIGTNDPDPTLRTLAGLVKQALDRRIAYRQQ